MYCGATSTEMPESGRRASVLLISPATTSFHSNHLIEEALGAGQFPIIS